MRRVTLDLTEEHHRALKQVALDEDLTQAALLRAATALLISDPQMRAQVVDAAREET